MSAAASAFCCRPTELQAAGAHAVQLLGIDAAGATQLLVEHSDEVPPRQVVTSIQVRRNPARITPPLTAPKRCSAEAGFLQSGRAGHLLKTSCNGAELSRLHCRNRRPRHALFLAPLTRSAMSSPADSHPGSRGCPRNGKRGGALAAAAACVPGCSVPARPCSRRRIRRCTGGQCHTMR